MAKILILDVETAPNIAYVWRFFKENIGAKQVLENGYMLSYAAKWFGEKDIFYEDVSDQSEIEMLMKLHDLLDQADIVVAHNGDKFDLPQIKGRLVLHGMPPPSPYKTVDTCRVARKQFFIPSNSLEYLAEVFKLRVKKSSHKKFPGFELWLEVLRNNKEAWKEMREYNIDDIVVLEALYQKMLPYISGHPNVATVAEGEEHACPTCGSHHVQRRGFYHTQVGKYQRFRCNECGSWSRTRYTEYPKERRKQLLTGAV